MKREYIIGGLFLLIFLAFLIGVTFVGGKPIQSSQPAIAKENTPQTLPPTPLPKEDATSLIATPVENSAALAADASSEIQSASKEEYWIAGYVSGEDGKVLPGAKIMVHIMDGLDESTTQDGEEDSVGRSVADEKGYYTIPLKEPHDYQVRSEPPEGYLTLAERLTLTQSQPNMAKHFVHPFAPLKLKGKVIDAKTKAPIEGAKIVLVTKGRDSHPKQQVEHAVSAADGTFTVIRLAKGTFYLQANAKGYVDFNPYRAEGSGGALKNIDVSEKTQSKEYIVEMQPGAAATFHVVNSLGQAVSNAQITISGDENEYDYVAACSSDANGYATNNSLPQRRLFAKATSEKEGCGFSKPFEPGTQDKPTWVEIKLNESASVSGKVVDGDGKPVDGNEVIAEIQAVEEWTYPPKESKKPDAQGNYSIANLAPGSYRVFLTKSNYYPKRVIQAFTFELKAGEKKTGVDFVLKRDESTEVKGIVLDEETNEPVEGVYVHAVIYKGGDILGSEGNKTDAKGEFIISNLSQDGDKIQFSMQDKEGYAHTILDRPAKQSYYTLKIKKSGQISGVVVDPNNQPISGARVTPVRHYGNSPFPMDYQAKSTGDDGKFEFSSLDPMDYSFRASAEGYVQTDSAKVSLKEGESVDSVVIQMQKGTDITGVVIDPNRQPLPDAILSIYSYIPNISRHSWSDHLSKQNFPENGRTDGEGKFTIVDFPPTGDTLIVQHDKLAPTKFVISQEAIAQKMPFTIQLTPGGTLMGTVYGSDGKGTPGVTIMTQNFPENLFRYETKTDKNGEYRLENLLPTSYMVINNGAPETSDSPVNGSVMVSGSGGSGLEKQQYKNASVEEGKTTHCDFNGGEGAVIHGVVYKRGQIAPNAKLGLECRSNSPDQIGTFLKTFANEQGAYSFKAVKPGVCTITVNTQANGSIDTGNCEYSTSVTVTEEQSDYTVDLFIASMEIQGTVIDRDSNEPVSGVQIQPRFRTGSTRPQGSQQLGAESDAEGKFSLLPQEGGEYSFIAVKDGYATEEFSVTVPHSTPGQVSQPVTVEVRLKKDGMAILIRLMLDGKPASCSWAQVYLQANDYRQRLEVIPLEEPGVYRAVGMQEGEAQLSVLAYCRAKVMNVLPQNVIARKGEVNQLVLNLYEMKDYTIFLHTSNDQTLEGIAVIELVDTPDCPPMKTQIRNRPERNIKNLVPLQIPSTAQRVRLSVEGFQPAEFAPETLIQQSGSNEENRIDLHLQPM